nr:acyl carrier protein [Erwinia rhapontici]
MLNQILPDSVGKSDQQLRMNNISGWDSMIQIAIALEVEEKFGITLSGSAISELTSFDALCQAIESR